MLNLHGHTDFSNIKLLDSTNTTESLIDEAVKLGHTGVAISDHESLSAHVKAIQHVKKLKKEGKVPEDWRLVLANEIYLIDSLKESRDNYQGGVTKFPHFLLVAKNKRGHEFLRRLSSIAWEQSFMTGLMKRTPTVKDDMAKLIKEYPGDIAMTNACLGGELAQHIVNDEYGKAEEFIEWCVSLVGAEDFYLEMQPNVSEEQIKVNKKLVEYSNKYSLDMIITFDVHYLRPEHREIHSAYLNAKQGDRETDSFYADTYYHETEEVYEKMVYLPKEVIDKAIENTDILGKQIEQYDLFHDPIIPQIEIPEFEVKHLFAQAYDKFPNIERASQSKEVQDRYILYLIEEGFLAKEAKADLSKEYFYKVMARIDEELYELLEISDKMNQVMSGYYITVKKIIDIIWDSSEDGGDSLVGGRGSVGAFYLAYLLGIIEFNPLTAGVTLPSWRHLDSQKPEISDIDLDSCATRRTRIISALKKYFGEDRLLSVSTFGTETSKSALASSMKGLGYNSDDATYLGSMIENSRGAVRSLSDSLSGDDGEPINTQLKNEMAKYPKLTETALSIESLVNKSSSHAGGVVIYNQPYWKTNAMMTTPSGMPVTQFNLKDSEYLGDVKYDILTTEAMDKLREGLDLLLEHNEIEWKGDLKSTFNHYFHPDKLEYDDPEMYELMASGNVPDMFQFTSSLGVSILSKVKPHSLLEVSSASNLMRLQAPQGEEQPVDTFARFRKDIGLWYTEMEEYGLTPEEVSIMEEHLLPLNGVCDSQEALMTMVMDNRIADFDRVWANKLRKAIAKKDPASLEAAQSHYQEHCAEIGTSDNLRDYVWDVQIQRQLGYSFPLAHSIQYSTVMFQELNMSHRFSPVYWQTACLNMNSGSIESEDESKGIDYGKVSTAVSKLQSIGVNIKPPSVNKSKYSFVPDAKDNAIIYGLKPIKTINDKVANEIIDNRPYSSLEDFLTKLYDTKIITNQHIVALVKSGALDEFGERKEIMMRVIRYITDLKESYTLSSINKLLESGALKDRPELPLVQLRESFKNKVLRKITTGKAKTPHKVYKVVDTEGYDKYGDPEAIIEVTNSYYEVDEKLFKKYFDKQTEQLKLWLKEDEVVDIVNRYELNQQWIKYALGSYSRWEMETLNFYHSEHELISIDSEKYGITRFSDISPEPAIEGYNKWRDKKFPIYKTYQVAGTVLGVDKTRKTVSILDVDGTVFNAKYQSGSFNHYDKTISKLLSSGKKKVIEKPWFERGNMLLITGYRRSNQFVAKVNKHSISQHTTKLITDIEPDGDLYYKIERNF